MKQKLMALLVLALFVISLVPMAIAEEESDVEADGTLEVQEDSDDISLGLGGNLRLKQRILEGRKDANEEKVDVLEMRKELVEAKVDFLARHREQISELIKKCEENGKSNEECKSVFEKRLRNLDSLPENFKQRLALFEERKDRKEDELDSLRTNINFGMHKKELKFKLRLIQKARLEDARKALIKAKLEFKESKLKVETAKLRLNEAKNLDKVCKNTTSEECIKAKAELLAAAKEHFAAQADSIIKTLEKIKSRIQGSEDISDAEETSLTAEIDAEIKIINEIKVKINAATNKDELLEAAKELRNAWKEMEHKIKRHAALVVSSRMAGIIVTSKHLEVKLEKVLARMTENGKNTSEVQALVDEFHMHIDLAKTSFEASQDLWLKVKLDNNTNVTVQQAQDKLKESKEHLKEAREVLWKIIQKMDKNALKEVEAEDEVEVSAEVNASAQVTA